MHTADRLTPAEREALALLAEACGEAVQAACKVLRHGREASDEFTGEVYENLEELWCECADVVAAVAVAVDTFGGSESLGGRMNSMVLDKLRRLQHYLHYADVSRAIREAEGADQADA